MFETELTTNEQQEIMQCTGWSMDVVGCIRTMAEARIYMNAGHIEARVDGRPALIRKDIDWSAFNCRLDWLKEKFADWKRWYDYNNADLIGEGWPPRDKNGDPYELHHIGQQQDSPFAELTWAEHMGDGNNAILHPQRESVIDRQKFEGEKNRYWQARFKNFSRNELKLIYGE